MADKSIKFEAQIDPKVSPKMEKLLKSYGQLTQKAFNTKDLEKYNKEAEKNIKYIEKHIKLTKQQAETMRQGPLKAMKEQEALFKSMTDRMDRAQAKLAGASATGEGFVARKMAEMGITASSDPAAYRRLLRQGQGITNRIASAAQGDINAGVDMLKARAQEEREAERDRRMERAAKIMAISAGVRVVGQGISSAGNLIYGQAERKMAFESEAAGFAGKIYNDVAGGDFSGLMAMSRDPAAMARFKEAVSDARMNSILGQVGEGVNAAGQIGMGAAQMYIGGGVGGMAALNAVQGSGGLVSGISSGASVIQNALAGKTGADVAGAALRGMEYMKNLDPIRQRQLMEMQARVEQAGEFGGEIAGTTGLNPWEAMQRIHRTGMAGGMGNLDQTMGIYQGLRSVGTTASALDPTNLAVATQAPWALGVSRQAAIAGIGTLGGMQGGALEGGSRLIEVMRKAMALGIEDSKLKETIITTLPSLMEGAGGRKGGLSPVDDLLALIDSSARRHGGPADQRDVNAAASGLKIAGMLTGGSSPFAPINTMTQAGVRGVAQKYRMRSTTGMSFGMLGIDELVKSQQTDALFAQSGIHDTAKREQILAEMRSRAASGVKAAFPGMNQAEIASALSKALNVPFDTTMSVLDKINNPNAKHVDSTGPAVKLSPEQQAAAEATIAKAMAQGTATDQTLGNKEMQAQLTDVMAAARSIVQTLGDLSKAGNMDALRGVPDLVNKVADSIEKLGRASAHHLGTQWEPERPK